MAQVRRKSLALGDLFIERMKPLCETYGFELVSTQDHATRGSQVAYAHPQGYQIVQALKEFDVIADFRAPDILRFGRSEERRVGQECVSTCRSRWWTHPS